jgi:3-oxoacyl-[acyl-carrier-protein] synthase III
MTITLDAVEAFFPDRVVTVEERAPALGFTPAQTHMFRRVHGLDRMHSDPELTQDDLMLPAAQKVLGSTDPRAVRHVIYAHALHGGRVADSGTAAHLRDMLGLEHAAAFAMTQQNCAVPLSAIDVAGVLLETDPDPDAKVLVVTGEKLPDPVAAAITTILVADGAAACLVGKDGPGAPVRSFSTRTRGEFAAGLAGTPEQFRAAAELRPVMVREVMDEAVARAGCTLADLQFIIPPNQGLPFWQGTLDAEDLLEKCVFENNARYSHCLGADVLINYRWLLDQGRLEPGRPSMFLATGLGWTYSAMVFEGAR